MANFNYDRTVNLAGYIPVALKDVAEIKTLMAMEQPGIEALWQCAEDCMDDQFIATATQNGIARREKIISIVPQAADTLEARRSRVWARSNENVPYTRLAFKQFLTGLCGEEYELLIKTSEFSVLVKLALPVKKQAPNVSDYLERILPYNMIFSVELIYNKWEAIKIFTWGELTEISWRDVREEVLPHVNSWKNVQSISWGDAAKKDWKQIKREVLKDGN